MRFQTSHKANVYLTENWLYSCTRELFFGMEAQLSIRKAWGQKKKKKKKKKKRGSKTRFLAHIGSEIDISAHFSTFCTHSCTIVAQYTVLIVMGHARGVYDMLSDILEQRKRPKWPKNGQKRTKQFFFFFFFFGFVLSREVFIVLAFHLS